MEKYQVGVVIMLSLIIGILLGMIIMGNPGTIANNTVQTTTCEECQVVEVIKEVEKEVIVIKEIIKEVDVCSIDIKP